MEKLWGKEVEKQFFNEASRFAAPEQLFYFPTKARTWLIGQKVMKAQKTRFKAEIL